MTATLERIKKEIRSLEPDEVEILLRDLQSEHATLPSAVPGPLAMLGYARQFHPGPVPTTDEAMREIRGGDED